MKLQLKTLGVIFSVVLNIALVTAYAIRKFSDRPRFVYQEVNLSKEQLALIEAGRDRFLRSINEIGDRIIVSHLELIDLIAAEGPDQQAIEGKVQAIRLGQTSMQRIVVDHLLEERQILTPEQRQRFFAVLKSRIQAQGAPGPPWLPKGARERKN